MALSSPFHKKASLKQDNFPQHRAAPSPPPPSLVTPSASSWLISMKLSLTRWGGTFIPVPLNYSP